MSKREFYKDQPHTVLTDYWTSLDDGRVQCDLCPRHCKLHEGQRGLCFVRGREDNQVLLYSYGRSSGFCIDPIEKKPLNHFMPGSATLSLGTAGCNLACKFCQNWDISKSREMDTLSSSATPEQLIQTAKRNACRLIAFTYNDPVIFLEYAIDTAKRCREESIRTVAVSAGYIKPKPREDFFRHMDAANIDLKAFTPRFYKNICGAELDVVLDTLCYIKQETQTWLEITTLLIPGENDSTAELHKECEWIMDNLGTEVPLHFSAFHPSWKMKNKDHTPEATLTKARRIALETGLRYVYTGNIHDVTGGSTYCPRCGQCVIERNWFELGEWHMDVSQEDSSGYCHNCGTRIAGVFEKTPGSWGRSSQPITRIS